MGKAGACAGVAILGAAASAGGIYLSRSNNFDSVLPKDDKEFGEKGHEEGCVAGLFPELKNLNPTDTSDGKWEANSVLENESKKDVQGCLVVNWDKENFGKDSEVKWKGKFRFLWAVRNGKGEKGLVVFAVAEPSNSKLKWTGGTYALEKKEGGWNVSKKLAVAGDGKEVDVGKFPKAKSIKPKYWGYLEEPNGSMTKVCGESDCGEGHEKKQQTYFQGYWTWTGSVDEKSGNGHLGDWMENLEEWWKEVFGEDKVKVVDVVKDMKGEWMERVWYGMDKPQEGDAQGAKKAS